MANKFASDVTNFFNRQLQKAEEVFATGEKTPVDPAIEQLTQDVTARQKWVTSWIGFADAVAEPNPTNRVEDKVLQTMDRKKTRTNEYVKLGESFISIGERVDQRSPHGAALVKAGQCQVQLGNARQELQQSIDTTYITWLREYMQNHCKAAMIEREKLDDARLDYDRARTLLKRAQNDPAKTQKFEQEVSEKKTIFDRQFEATKQKLQECVDEFDKHKDALRQLMITQREYYDKCSKALETALN